MNQVQAAAGQNHDVAVAALFIYRSVHTSSKGKHGISVNDCFEALYTPNFRSRHSALHRKFPQAFRYEWEKNERDVGGNSRAHRRHFLNSEWRGNIEKYVRKHFKRWGFER